MAEVSIVIPVYNTEKYVEKCIRSVLEQSFSDLEILVIDDGSTDGSRAILERLASEDARIHLLTQENRGVAAARNRGIEAASGRYLTFIDGDDYVAVDYIEALHACALQTGAQMVLCGATYVDEDGKVQSRLVPGSYERLTHEEWTFRISAACSHFYLRELWEKYPLRFCSGARGEDMPVSLFWSAVCPSIAVIPNAGYFYVQHTASAMHNFRGLKNYQLPYRALEESIAMVRQVGITNSPEFHELFVLRILATCYFQLAPGASREKMQELCRFIRKILGTYFPKYYANKKARLWAPIDVPLAQKLAVKLLILLVRTGLLEPVGRIWL